MSKIKIKTDKKDPLRALLTDTSPYEVPLIFSNEGLYVNLKKINSSAGDDYKDFISGFYSSNPPSTMPYKYKINKGDGALRSLSLIHPLSQVKYSEFYDEYGGLILYFCRESRTSIRSPEKVGDIYYIDGSVSAIDKYRRDDILTVLHELRSKYSVSFFSYSGYNRLHSFIGSTEYLRLEKKFSTLVSIDISSCFDSIYTHSMSWATKNKVVSKLSIGRSSFGNDFDRLMQMSNHGETNGIPIGAEVSRVFAEIILEQIDKKVLSRLADLNVLIGRDFAVRRYVDDYFIFSNDDSVLDTVMGFYVDELSSYNLSVNPSKTNRVERPFFTVKSSVILHISDTLNNFYSSITSVSKNKLLERRIVPNRIRSGSRVFSDFVRRVKNVCAEHKVGYGAVSSYIISSVYRRSVSLIESYDDEDETVVENEVRICFEVLANVAFFFYTTSPVVSSSYELCKFVVLVSRFFDLNFPESSPAIKQNMYEGCVAVLRSPNFETPVYVDNHISIEKINILIVLSELGDDYLLPPEFLMKELINEARLGYFEIISILYYIKNYDQYNSIKVVIYKRLKAIFSELKSLDVDSGAAHLFFDIASCPYINEQYRLKLIKKYRFSIGLSRLSEADSVIEAKDFLRHSWFVGWEGLDLLNCLEKKALKMAY